MQFPWIFFALDAKALAEHLFSAIFLLSAVLTDGARTVPLPMTASLALGFFAFAVIQEIGTGVADFTPAYTHRLVALGAPRRYHPPV